MRGGTWAVRFGALPVRSELGGVEVAYKVQRQEEWEGEGNELPAGVPLRQGDISQRVKNARRWAVGRNVALWRHLSRDDVIEERRGLVGCQSMRLCKKK